MREIKFRAWNGVLHEYRTIDMNSGKQNIGMGFESTEGIGSNTTTIYHSFGDVIEQYTGVDDANNIPIYEGDIIRGLFTADEGLTLSGDRIPYFGQVEWCSQSNCLGWYVESQDGGMFELEKCHAKISLDNITGEVIGNIHENPELLEEVR